MTALVVLVLDLARSGVQSISASSLFKKQMHLVCQPHEIDFSCEHFNLFLRTTDSWWKCSSFPSQNICLFYFNFSICKHYVDCCVMFSLHNEFNNASILSLIWLVIGVIFRLCDLRGGVQTLLYKALHKELKSASNEIIKKPTCGSTPNAGA